MSVQEASTIANRYRGSTSNLPPRGLGENIGLFVKFYQDPLTRGSDNCESVKIIPTPEIIDSIGTPAWGVSGYKRLMGMARFEHFQGNIDYAISYAEGAVRKAEYDLQEAEGYFELASYLSAGGDYAGAQRALDNANRLYSNEKNSRPDKRGKFKRRYLAERAKATVRLAQGNTEDAILHYNKALSVLLDAREHYPVNVGHQWVGYAFPDYMVADLKLGIAAALLWQGNLLGAEIFAREALRCHGDASLPHIFIMLSKIFYEQGRYSDAETTAKTALNIIISNRILPNSHLKCISSDAFVRASARYTLAQALLAKGEWKQSLEQFEYIQQEMTTATPTYERVFIGTRNRGLALLKSGQLKAAIREFTIARQKIVDRVGEEHYETIEASGFIAVAEAELGHDEKAIRILDQIVPLLLERWQDHASRSTRQPARLQRLEMIIETYLQLLVEDGKPVNITKAFEIASALQSRNAGQLITESAFRSNVKDPDLARIIRDRQDVEIQLAELQNRIVVALDYGLDLKSMAPNEDIKKQRDQLRNAIEALDEEIRDRFPDHAIFLNRGMPSVEKIKTFILENEALLTIFIGGKASYCWVLNHTGELSFHKDLTDRNELQDIVNQIRASVEPKQMRTITDIPPFECLAAYRIYSCLFAPLEDAWKSKNHLLWIANAPMDLLPLSLLPTVKPSPKVNTPIHFLAYRDVQWLVRTHAVSRFPSVAAFQEIRALPAAQNYRRPFIGFGDPWFTDAQRLAAMKKSVTKIEVYRRERPNTRELDSADISCLPALTETAQEVEIIADVLGSEYDESVFTGDRATETRIKQMDLTGYAVMIFATHGLMPGDLDGLHQPALALSAPAVTGETENDGLLTAGEIMWLKLDARWVVLSACNTDYTEVSSAQAVSNIGQAFFYAGAKALLVTTWAVETTSAKALTTTLFREHSSDLTYGRADALRRAKINLIDNIDGPGFSYAHPIFWAPFVAIGG